MKTICICLLLIGGIVFSSCDPLCVYNYKVYNTSGFTIHVRYTTYSQKDTTVILTSGQNYTIFNDQGVCGGVEDYQKSDSMLNIKNIIVSRQDTILSKNNYILRSFWNYTKQEKYKAEYSATITREDF
jgi:hypothetical protein